MENGVVHDKIIIGGGAAGLMAAFSACSIRLDAGESPDVVLLERGEVPGKKLTATGNGKCNFTNKEQSAECYRGSDSDKAYRIINLFDSRKTIDLFKSIGILHRERNGYCYPYGEQAKSVRDVLCNLIIGMGVEILTEKNVTEIVNLEKIYSKEKNKESYTRG